MEVDASESHYGFMEQMPTVPQHEFADTMGEPVAWDTDEIDYVDFNTTIASIPVSHHVNVEPVAPVVNPVSHPSVAVPAPSTGMDYAFYPGQMAETWNGGTKATNESSPGLMEYPIQPEFLKSAVPGPQPVHGYAPQPQPVYDFVPQSMNDYAPQPQFVAEYEPQPEQDYMQPSTPVGTPQPMYAANPQDEHTMQQEMWHMYGEQNDTVAHAHVSKKKCVLFALLVMLAFVILTGAAAMFFISRHCDLGPSGVAGSVEQSVPIFQF